MSSVLTQNVLLSSSPEYEEANQSYFTAFNNDISPLAIACPTSAEDVSVLLKELAKSETKIAVRGGGHTPWKGAANIHNGITIDMRGLKGVRLSIDETIVSVGAGERWENVYEVLEKRGLAVGGGRVSRVGVTGLTLGGGLSYFSGSRGFVCDAVVNYQVVLASGEIIDVNNGYHADLFTSLKGGGNNFGIVTRIDFSTFPQGKLWGGVTAYPGASTAELLRLLHDYVTRGVPDEHSHVLVSVGHSTTMGGEIGVASTYHTQPNSFSDSPASLSTFTSLQPQLVSSVRLAPLSELSDEQSSFSIDGGRNLYFTTTVLPDMDLLLEIRTLFLQSVEKLKDFEDLAFSVVFQPITKQSLTKSVQSGRNALGLKPEDGPQINVLLNPVWKNKDHDDRIIEECHLLISGFEAAAMARGKASSFRFMNYSYCTQGVFQGYGEESLDHLWKVSRRYDPTGFFQKRVVGGFKLPTD